MSPQSSRSLLSSPLPRQHHTATGFTDLRHAELGLPPLESDALAGPCRVIEQDDRVSWDAFVHNGQQANPATWRALGGWAVAYDKRECFRESARDLVPGEVWVFDDRGEVHVRATAGTVYRLGDLVPPARDVFQRVDRMR